MLQNYIKTLKLDSRSDTSGMTLSVMYLSHYLSG